MFSCYILYQTDMDYGPVSTWKETIGQTNQLFRSDVNISFNHRQDIEDPS